MTKRTSGHKPGCESSGDRSARTPPDCGGSRLVRHPGADRYLRPMLTKPFKPLGSALILAAALLLSSCAQRRIVVVAPAVDPEQLALALEDHTGIERPIRVVFGWQLNEGGVRVSGRGVARVEPPYRARLDLFLGNGETVVRAALVDGELRLPPGAPDNILPPADLMWGVLGVFKPEQGISLVGADRLEGGDLQLRYRYEAGRELHYRVHEGRIGRMEILDGGHVVERVELEMAGQDRYPVNATYRNMAAFRELKMSRESVEAVEPFAPDIWQVNR